MGRSIATALAIAMAARQDARIFELGISCDDALIRVSSCNLDLGRRPLILAAVRTRRRRHAEQRECKQCEDLKPGAQSESIQTCSLFAAKSAVFSSLKTGKGSRPRLHVVAMQLVCPVTNL